MEEILASIRQIISDDSDKKPEKDGGTTPAGGAVSKKDAGDDDVASTKPANDQAKEVKEEDDDVLVLTEMVEDDGTIVSLATQEGAPATPAHVEQTGDTTGASGESVAKAKEPTMNTTSTASDFTRKDSAASSGADTSGGAGNAKADGMISNGAATSASQAINKLAQAVMTEEEKRDAALTVPDDPASRALHELVKDAMRPMLKEWLDQHLPAIVERTVTKEIRKITRQIED